MTSKRQFEKGVPSRPTKTPAKPPAAVKSAEQAKPVPRAKQLAQTNKTRPKNGIPQLPRGTIGKGLKYNNIGEGIQKRLAKKSPWFSSITDPIHGADVKIPDETGIETGTFQLVEKHVIKATPFAGQSENGACGFTMISPYINSSAVGVGARTGANLQYLKDNSNGYGDWGWANTTGVFVEGLSGPFEGINQIQQMTNEHRIVSACLTVQPEAALATNQGEYCLFATPFGYYTNNDYDTYVNRYKSVVVPISDPQAGMVRWFPFARDDWSFKNFVRTDGTMGSYDDNTDGAFPFWNLGVVVTGAEPGTIFRITVAINYEFVPKWNTFNVLNAKPSPSDATEVDLVENWTQDMDVATVVPQKQVSRSPAAAPVQHGENDSGTGFGMFFNVISELAPLALALL